MKRIVTFSLILFFCIGIAFSKPVQAAEKLGSVDITKLFDEYQKTKEFSKALDTKVSAYEKERDGKLSDIKQMQDKINLLTDKEKEKKQKELEDKAKSIREFAVSKESELRKERDDKLKEISKDIEDAIQQYSKKESYTMVFNDKVFAYYAKTNDITDKVLEILQANYKKNPSASSGK